MSSDNTEQEDVRLTLKELREQQKQISDTLAKLSEPRKTWLDYLPSITTFLSTVVIAGLGTWFTASYNAQQGIREERLKEQQLRLSEVEMVQKFMPQLTSSGDSKRVALLALSSLGNTQLAARLAELDRSPASLAALEHMAQTDLNPAEKRAVGDALENLHQALGRNARQARATVERARGGSRVGRTALEFALKELEAITVEEQGKNRGARIDKYQALYGLRGAPWTSMFVGWCYAQVDPRLKGAIFPSVEMTVRQFIKFGWYHAAKSGYNPQPGDIAFFNFGDEAHPRYHVGIVTDLSEGRVYTLEGNTREASLPANTVGGMVAMMPRKLTGVTGFGHIPDDFSRVFVR